MLLNIVEKHPKTNRFEIHEQLDRHISLDPERTQKYRLGNLEIKKKNRIALEQYPELEDRLTNNMAPVPSDTQIEEIGFQYENHYLIVPSYLQKNKALIQILFDLWTGNFGFYIGISLDKLGEKQSDYAIEEAEHWYGPIRFDDLSDSVQIEQLTVYGNDNESFTYGLQDNLEVLSKRRDDEWIVEIEELLPRQSMMNSYEPSARVYRRELKYYTRYAHLILDEDLNTCFHLDGALREYPSLNHFSKRHTDSDKNLQSDYHKNNRFNKYKVFKLDNWQGNIEDVSKILIGFFKYSPHILRFFNDDIEQADELELQRARLFKREFDQNSL